MNKYQKIASKIAKEEVNLNSVNYNKYKAMLLYLFKSEKYTIIELYKYKRIYFEMVLNK